jgi:hypothetical protein
MAIISTIFCQSCQQEKMVGHSASSFPDSICDECKEKQTEQRRIDHLAKMKLLPIEERIALIEAWIYDYVTNPPMSYSDIMNMPIG